MRIWFPYVHLSPPYSDHRTRYKAYSCVRLLFLTGYHQNSDDGGCNGNSCDVVM